MSMCSIFSCVVGRGCLLWPVCSVGKTLFLPCFILYSKAKFACYSRYLLIPTLHSSHLWWKRSLFWVLVLEGLVDLHRTIQIQLLQHWGIELDYCDIEWFSLETNRDHSVVFEIAMAPHSSTLAWKLPWTEEPGGLQSMGLLRVGHDWATSLSLFTFMHWRRKWQPTPVFLPGESQGRGAWWASVYGVAQSRTRLKRLSSSSTAVWTLLLTIRATSFLLRDSCPQQ